MLISEPLWELALFESVLISRPGEVQLFELEDSGLSGSIVSRRGHISHRVQCNDAKSSSDATDKVHILELPLEVGVAGRPDDARSIPLRSGAGATLV